MFIRLADQHRQFVRDLVTSLQALAIVLERRGYVASCYTCEQQRNSASFMVSLGDDHLIRFLVSDYGITWTEMCDDRELMKLEGAEAITQLQDLANMVKYETKAKPQPSQLVEAEVDDHRSGEAGEQGESGGSRGARGSRGIAAPTQTLNCALRIAPAFLEGVHRTDVKPQSLKSSRDPKSRTSPSPQPEPTVVRWIPGWWRLGRGI